MMSSSMTTTNSHHQIPHSPDLESASMEHFPPLFKLKTSPLSLLALELDSSLSLGGEAKGDGNGFNSITSNFASGKSGLGKDFHHTKTPRRSLLSQLAATANSSPIYSDIGGECMQQDQPTLSTSKNAIKSKATSMNHPIPSSNGLFTSPLAPKSPNIFHHSKNVMTLGLSGLSSESDDHISMCSNDGGQLNLNEGYKSTSAALPPAPCFQNITRNPFAGSSDEKNPLNTTMDAPAPPVAPFVFKPKPAGLKFRDQNEGRLLSGRPNLSKLEPLPKNVSMMTHWNQRKPTPVLSTFTRHKTFGMLTAGPTSKKREGDSKSPVAAAFATQLAVGSGRGSHAKADPNIPPRKIRRAMTFNGGGATENCAPPADDFFATPEPLLPSFHEDGKDMIRRITPETLYNLLNSPQFSEKVDQVHLIDCRYPFEYDGGHIKSSMNVTNVSDIQEKFFHPLLLDKRGSNTTTTSSPKPRCVVIFHCEYSIQRAPQMALYFRGQDRNANKDTYPSLFYPDVYILQGGYRSFFSTYKTICEPQSYIEMTDSSFTEECREAIIGQKKQFNKI